MLKNGEIEEYMQDAEDHENLSLNNSYRSLPIPSVPRGGAIIRKRWSDEERAAVDRGVQRYGVGSWKQIKEDNELADVLSERTTVQIKVCVL
jgi:hypothetical protein